MSENIELSERDLADLEALGVEGGELPNFHPVLEVWREVLKPATELAAEKVTPQWASRMVATYTGLKHGDMNELRDRYYAKIAELAAILDFEIATDENCLVYTTPEEDVAENSHHYKSLLLNWQLAFLAWELAWDCADPHAVVELAAISEVHKMFFSETGLTQFLDNIRFEYTEADRDDLTAALNELREGEK
jgi:hypothetical protein